jgi:hypothetical protein
MGADAQAGTGNRNDRDQGPGSRFVRILFQNCGSRAGRNALRGDERLRPSETEVIGMPSSASRPRTCTDGHAEQSVALEEGMRGEDAICLGPACWLWALGTAIDLEHPGPSKQHGRRSRVAKDGLAFAPCVFTRNGSQERSLDPTASIVPTARRDDRRRSCRNRSHRAAAA